MATGSKLPRKTVSMAKRGAGQAKAPTLGVKGKAAEEEPDAEETEEAIPANAFTTTQLTIGVLGAAAIILGVVIVTALLFDEPDGASYSMLPDGYRAAVGLDAEEEQAILADILGTAEEEPAYGSPFPDAQGRPPIILDVACPDGTVQIATGSRPVDTVCIKGRLVEPDAEPEPTVSPTIVIVPSGATIGDHTVPPLTCREDELIGMVGLPGVLACVHIDTLSGHDAPAPTGNGSAAPSAVPPMSLPDAGSAR